MPQILVAARDGLHTVDDQGQERPTQHGGRPVTAVVRDDLQLWAIVDRAEVWHAPEGEWRQVSTLEGATLVTASTNLPGRLVLSDFTCDDDKKDPPKK